MVLLSSIASPCLPWQLPSCFSPSSRPLATPLVLPPLQTVGRSPLFASDDLLPRRSGRNAAPKRRRNGVVCEVVVELDGPPSTEGENSQKPAIGSRVRVSEPLKVFHVPKTPEFDLQGCEGVIKDVLRTWKGKPLSANMPYKVQFILDIEGRQVKFFSHLKEEEFEVIG